MFVFKHPKYYSELKKHKRQAQATGGKEEKEKELEKDTGEKKSKKNLKRLLTFRIPRLYGNYIYYFIINID